MPISSSGGGPTRSPCGDDLEAEATIAAEALEAEYTAERLRDLVAKGGTVSDG